MFKTRTKVKAIIIATLCFVSFTAGTAFRDAPKIVTKEVFVIEKVATFHHLKDGSYFGVQKNRIAASVPASALYPQPRPAHKPQQFAGK